MYVCDLNQKSTTARPRQLERLTTTGVNTHTYRMDRSPRSNLHYVGSPRERELLDLVRDTEFERVLRGEVDFAKATGGEQVIGDRAPLAQDAFRSILFRQGGIHKRP